MIASGEKTEEYRSITPHWTKIITAIFPYKYNVCFHRGYTKTTMTFRIERIDMGTGKEEWGAEPGKKYYIIVLGKRK